MTGKTFVVAVSFENSAIAKNGAGANDSRVSIVVVVGSIRLDEWSEIGSSKDLVRIFVVFIIALFDRWRK